MVTTSLDPVSLISNVGFPIVAFLLMYRMARDTIKDNTEAIEGLKNEMQRLRGEVDQ